jgi:hypothetical protein
MSGLMRFVVVCIAISAALFVVAFARADEGTWWPDGVVCTPYGDCRYVAPGCQLVRVMDPGTRYELWCRAPRGAE